MITITTDLGLAQSLHHLAYPNPRNLFESWEGKLACFDHGHDNIFFIYDDEIVVPLQVSEEGNVEWFGGWLVENVSISHNTDKLKEAMRFISRMENEIDQLQHPIPDCTDPSIIVSYIMKKPVNWDAWNASLSRKRRWELRRADKDTLCKRYMDVDEGEAIRWADKGIELLLESFEQRSHLECYFKYPHFQRVLKNLVGWLSAYGNVDVYTRNNEEGVVGVAFGCQVRWEDTYHWIFSAHRHDLSRSLGKALISDVVKGACDLSNIRLINGFADEIGKHTFKAQMGFTPLPQWCLKTSTSGLRHLNQEKGVDDDELHWLYDTVNLNLRSCGHSQEIIDRVLDLKRKGAWELEEILNLTSDLVHQTKISSIRSPSEAESFIYNWMNTEEFSEVAL